MISNLPADALALQPGETELERLQRLREVYALLERQKELKKLNGLAFYKPHAGQERFHTANKPRRYARTGNRWGKSTCGAAEDIAWCMGERIWYPVGDKRRLLGLPQHSVKGVLIVSDWDKASEIFTSLEEGEGRGKLFKLCPADAYVDCEKNQSGHICKLLIKSRWGGVSSLYIDTVKSFKSNPLGHESSDWDFVHVDEPLPQDMWNAYARGLVDRGGCAWFCCTPVTEMWINDYFIPGKYTRDSFESGQSFEEFNKPDSDFSDRWVITGSIHDNTTLSAENVQRFVRELPKDEREARISGRPKALVGAVYKDFDPEIHVYSGTPHGWRDATLPPSNYTIRLAIDPHPKVPHAVLFAATSPYGQTYFFSEIFEHVLIKDLCEMISGVLRVGKLDGEGKPDELFPFVTLCDPCAWIENPIDGTTWAQDFMNHNVFVQPASKDLSRGILRVGEALRKRDKDGNPTMFFHDSLYETLREFDRYVWEQKKEKPVDMDDHMMECLYRLVLSDLTWINMTEKPKTIKPLSLDHVDFGSMGLWQRREPSVDIKRRRRELALRC